MSIRITPKEQRIIALVAEGLKNGEIAKVIGTTDNAVKNYIRIIFDKTGMWTRLELALWHVKRNVIPSFDEDSLVDDAVGVATIH